jgi:hypothetical protein
MEVSMNSVNNPLKCSLGRIQPKQIDAEKLKREGWKNDGILVIKVDDERLSWPEKELIKQIGDKIYNNKTNDKTRKK